MHSGLGVGGDVVGLVNVVVIVGLYWEQWW